MQELLGITPANDAEGILQDMHWSDGSFGYFPSDLLGSIYDGMYLEAIQKDLGDLDTVLENGRILDITHWLKEKIHRFGSMYNSKEVIQRVCGKEISAQPLLRYFEEKYSKVYEFLPAIGSRTALSDKCRTYIPSNSNLLFLTQKTGKSFQMPYDNTCVWRRNRFSGFSNQAIPFLYIRFTAAFLKSVPALLHLPILLPSWMQTALQLLHFPALPRFHS